MPVEPTTAADPSSGSDGVGTAPRRRIDPRVLRRALMLSALVAVVLLASYLIPMPSIASVRSWGEGLGPGFVWAFFAAYALITIAPIPRSTFTVTSGVLFGPLVGFTGAMIASTIAAVVAFVLVRAIGRERVRPHLKKPVVAAVEYRLSRRGWLAVGSLRLIAACPFSVANYCSGLSSVRVMPYIVASVIGMAPSTAAVVFLGDALTGQRDPLMLLLSASLFALGIVGLVLDARLPVRDSSPAE
ncbi:TVP38/TMEM64 family protein [Gordonia sp. CPCC 206044]|uniref:TVP38/TMEM64 family protein n=1 Tax=Gordonia sp. CPCC 206044 TaxID=3140793 RepID=UPI003AF36C4E